jgi:hypothetical protein
MERTAVIVEGKRGHIIMEANGKVLVSFGYGDRSLYSSDDLIILKYLDRNKLLKHLYAIMEELQHCGKWYESLEIGLLIRRINKGTFDVIQEKEECQTK